MQSFVFLGLLVFELEPTYATSDGQTDGRTTDADHRLMPPPLLTTWVTCRVARFLAAKYVRLLSIRDVRQGQYDAISCVARFSTSSCGFATCFRHVFDFVCPSDTAHAEL